MGDKYIGTVVLVLELCNEVDEMRVAVAITGASGLPLAFKLIEVLKERVDLEVAVSGGAVEVAKREPCRLGGGPCNLIEELRRMGIEPQLSITSKLASSSNVPDAVVVIPCSMKTLALIANGIAEGLVPRLALNALRTGRELVLVPRETPVGSVELENMLKASRAGAKVVLPSIAFYTYPKTLEDVVNFIVGKVLDVLRIEHNLYPRYGQAP